MKKLFIETLGCQMNSRDTEHIIAELNKYKNYTTTSKLDDADLIIINTCSVRQKPVQKLFSELGMFNKKKKSSAKIGVCGCTASHLGDEIIKKAPYVDFVLGARNVSKISKVIDKKGAVEIDINHDESTYTFEDFRSNPYKTSVNISIGCDKSCTYCIVPNTRGYEISIPQEIIINEITKAVNNGATEVMLLGQNVNSYGKYFSDNRAKSTFTQLLKEVSNIKNLKRIRFTSPHPLHMDDEFIQEFASNPKICKSIHVPLQSGSTKVLKDMKRGYSKEWFLNRVQKIKSLVPNVRISTDIIVAFPTETQEDFLETLDVIEQVRFDQIFNFKYSPRPNTQALEYKTLIPDDIASKRLDEVIQLHKAHQEKIMPSHIGKTYEVFFDELKANKTISGYTDNFIQVFAKGSEEFLGKFKKVKITDATRTALQCEILFD
jgi:tRNA-2-methylthio-N6-dimethylallyladenosine synthase